ncbi:MAG: hypothetical protein HN976_02890, partial [Lentisphaerae bacterium]|nr:hypothetical protein [Lentisphaerota bacterium]
ALRPAETDLVLLPEYATTPGLVDREVLRRFATDEGKHFVELICDEARRLGSIVVLGAAVESGGHWFNRTLVVASTGDLAGHYDKRHLTAVEEEHLGMTAGATPIVMGIAGLRLGFAVCFDVYFPEHFEALAACAPDVVLSPSYQRSESAERNRLLACCRALDTGAWFVRASYAMGTPGVGGHGLIAAPDGTLVDDAGDDEGVLSCVIDPDQRFRKPASHGENEIEHRGLIETHRRPWGYRPLPDRTAAVEGLSFPRLCAHRGLSHVCPENTIPAFAAAIALPGVAEIELDVWLSRDGVPVVCHDPSLERTTDGEGTVVDLDWPTIRSCDAGVRLSEAWAGVPIPRLEEVLDLTAGRVFLNLHIKAPGEDGALVRLVGDLLRERCLTGLGYIAGEEDVLAAAKRWAPDLERACLAHQSDPPCLISTAIQYECTRLQFFRNVEEDHIRQAHDAGLLCNLFWADEPEDARRYADMGIDVILTNQAHQLVGELPPRPGVASC